MEALQDDNGDGGMLCTEHPFKNNTPAGGICAFCLQEKLGKLVSSSFPIAVFPSSSSSSPSFRSDINVPTTTTTTTTISSTVAPPRLIASNPTSSNDCNYHHYYSNNNSNGSNKSRILYLLGQKKKKNKKDSVNIIDDRSKNMLFKRSKSTVTPRRGSGWHFTESDPSDNINSPHKQRGFWSFLYLQKHSQQQKTLRDISSNNLCSSSVSSYPQAQRSKDMIVVEENESPCQASFDRKVSRSRSVGCGSRSFSGDFFERISTGFGDCTLRRVESQREGKSKVSGIRGGGGGQDCIKERVRCGGLFSGFMITSSSSSSSSSSLWANNNNNNNNNESSDLKMTSAVTSGNSHHQQHSRSKSWGWALASPMRAFSKPSSSSKKEQQAATNKNQTPNLAAIPSLLSVRS